ncbi:MAG TPA: polysaccharide biosynthesis/export family protein, partial [Flavipsychrobacter sp.]|nr:polysaccharide biosynthesis/export family protein [Flavipsychrobacter sp.]
FRLNVTITTIDQEANGAANISSADASKFSFSTSGLPTTSANTAYGYLVDKNGFITLPVLGKVVVGGKTIVEIQDIILDKASKIFKEPTINVRLMNFKVTVLGEVLKPGTYIIDGERVSILSALGLAGDLTIFGKRKNVLLIRQDGENNKKMVRLDLNDSHLFTSPYYYLKQGDVLYVEPTKGKAAANDVAFTRNYAIASSVITLVIVLITRFKF